MNYSGRIGQPYRLTSSSGSVDQKYPYDVENIRINTQPTIVILDGGGYSAGAERWLKAQVGGDNCSAYAYLDHNFAKLR